MKKHTKVYLQALYPRHATGEFIPCEICIGQCVKDIHHMKARGMGGSKLRDFLENLLGTCRSCHELCEDTTISYVEQLQYHRDFMIRKNIEFDDYYFELEFAKFGIELEALE